MKKQENLGVALRYLQILSLLNRRQSWGTRDIQQAIEALGFQVSIRTIQRDLRALQKVFPGLKSFGSSTQLTWRWERHAPVIDIPGWDLSMAVAIKMAHLHLHTLLPPQVLLDLQPYFDKADAMLSNSHSHLQNWEQKVAVSSRAMPLQAPKIQEEVLTNVYSALLNEYPLEIVYKNRSGDMLEAVFSVAGIVVQEQVIYLVGCFWGYDDVRHLALHRLQQAKRAENAQYHVPEGFNLQQYLKTQKAFSYPVSDQSLNLRVRIDRYIAKHLQETPLSPDQQIYNLTESKTHVILRATVPDTQKIRWWLMGLGDQVEVLEPQSLRNELAEMIGRMHHAYNKDGSNDPQNSDV